MNEFEHNIISIHKEKGKSYLANLPELVKEMSRGLELTDLRPMVNLSFNYVLSGLQKGTPIILKMNPTTDELIKEANALKAFAGYGAVKILAEDKGALLLERAVSGYSLKTYLPDRGKEILPIICKVTKRLHEAPIPQGNNFPHIKDWLTILDKDWPMPSKYLEKARTLKNKLLATQHKLVLLHGDLHHDNILTNGEEFVVIDPKGVIGYAINEVWAFIIDFMHDTEYVANYFQFDLREVREWYFVHLVLATCWNLEDNLDSKKFLDLIEKTYFMV